MSVFPRDEDDEIITNSIYYEEIVDANVKLFKHIYDSWKQTLPIVRDTLDLLLKEFDEVKALKVLYDLTQDRIDLSKDYYSYVFSTAYRKHYGTVTNLNYYKCVNEYKKSERYEFFGASFNKAIAEDTILFQMHGDIFATLGKEIMKEVAYFIFHVHDLNYV